MEQEVEQKACLIDQIVSADIPKRVGVHKLYEGARESVNKPLCLAAAEKIIAGSRKGKNCFIITGFPVLPNKVCETDGPPGTFVLAQTIRKLGLVPLIITDEVCADVVKAISNSASVIEFPIDNDLASRKAKEILSKYNPSLLISIERPGWNKKKVHHTMGGLSISEFVGKTDYLFEMARQLRIVTFAVGDGGNELGFGTMTNAVEKYVPFGFKCQCRCGGGIAAEMPADSLVVARISNWGAYGIAACISLLKQLTYVHDGQSESELLERIITAGGIDSVTKKAEPFVDGLSLHVNSLVAELIFKIVNV